MNSETVSDPWYANLLLVVGVVLTVVMALLMSQLDRLQTRLVPTVQVVAQATEPIMTPTPLSAIALATAVPASPTSIESTDNSMTPGSTAVPTAVCGQSPDGWVAYMVRAGDTLYALSKATGVAVDEIQRVNCLEARPLVIGEQIYLPMTPPSPRIACGPPGQWVRYTVQAGDTMFSLARSRDTTVYQIMNANCLVSASLYAGRQIYLPPGRATAVPTATTAPPSPKPPRPTNTAVPPTNTATPPPVATITPTNTLVPPTLTNTPVPPTLTNTPVPPTPTSTPVASGNASLKETPGTGALGLTAFWLGLGLVFGMVLVADNPLGRKRP